MEIKQKKQLRIFLITAFFAQKLDESIGKKCFHSIF